MKKCKVCGKELPKEDFVKAGKKLRVKCNTYKQNYRRECRPCWSKAEMKRYRSKKIEY